MGRKRNAKGYHSPDNNSLYHKRLRSWKQTSSQLKSNHLSSSIDENDIRIQSRHKSTIFTYPINLHQNNLSNTILSQSLTTDSAFFGSSIPCFSTVTAADLNNNHVAIWNPETKKRKVSSTSCELDSSSSSTPDAEESVNSLRLKNPTKRSRIKDYDDDCTIDINQLDRQEPISSSIDDQISNPIQSLANDCNSMEVAVKMVQPIVDIIFNAFEDQLKHMQSSCSNSISTSQFHRSVAIPYFPIHPIILHAVNFDIQLTTKKAICTSLNHKSYFSSNEYLITKYKLKRIVQLALIGASVLCGYLFF